MNETVVEGTDATVRVLTDGSLELIDPTGKTERRPVALPTDDLVYIDGYAATQRHFIEGILSGHPHETSATDNIKTMDIVWTAYRSAEEGRRLPV